MFSFSSNSKKLLIDHPTLFSSFELSAFENEILNNPNATEHDASHFFERFPQFLLLGQYSEIQREVTLHDAQGNTLGRVDFFRKKFGCKHWDLVELKSPKVPIIVYSSGKHPHLSSITNKAISQAEDYRQWIDEDKSVKANLMRRGLLCYRPNILVVCGQISSEIPQHIARDLYDRASTKSIEVCSYSDLFEFAKESYESSQVLIVFNPTINTLDTNRTNDIPSTAQIPSLVAALPDMTSEEIADVLWLASQTLPSHKEPNIRRRKFRVKLSESDSEHLKAISEQIAIPESETIRRGLQLMALFSKMTED